MQFRNPELQAFVDKAMETFDALTFLTERTARISLVVCTAIVAGSCISVSALSINARESSIYSDVPDQDIESLMITYEQFEDITSDDDPSASQEERIANFITEASTISEETSETSEEDDEEVSAEVIRNTAPKNLTDRQVKSMLTGNAGPVRVIDRKDINEGAASSGSSKDTGNASAAQSNSSGVTKSFDTTSNYVIGIDVSGWNGAIKWDKVKSYGVKFVMIKCGGRYTGSGKIYKDSKFETNASGAAAAGISVGVYFYSAATSIAEAYEEASFTVDVIKGHKISYPVAIDFEINASNDRHAGVKGEALRDVLCTFCDTVQSQGYTPMVYMSSSCWTSVLGSKYASEVTSKYKVWLAAYFYRFMSGTEAFKIGDKLPSFPYRYHIWQYGYIHGVVPGISGDVDMNLGFFSSTKLTDPSIKVNQNMLYTTEGKTVVLNSAVTAINSLGQTVNVDNLNVTVKNSKGTSVSLEDACKTPGVYTLTLSFGDAYMGTVSQTAKLYVGNASDGSIPGCTPTPTPSAATATAAPATEAPATEAPEAAAPTSSAATSSPTSPASTEAPAPEPVVQDQPSSGDGSSEG